MGSTTSKTTTGASNGDGLPKTALEAVQGLDLSGKTFLVTGSYSGLGVACTKAFLTAGASVIVAGRNETLQQDFCKELREEFETGDDSGKKKRIDGSHLLDLADLASVKDFASYVKETYPTVDGLILNAGVMNTPCGQTKQGLEMQMGVNAVGHFLLAKILAGQTKRQVWVSSRGHSLYQGPPSASNFDNAKAPAIDVTAIDKVEEAKYDGWMRYQQSKLANVLLAKQFGVAYPDMETAIIHPGLVQTNLMRHANPLLMIVSGIVLKLQGRIAQTPEEGARTQTWVAVMPSAELVQGGYYGYCKLEQEADVAKNMDDAKTLFDYCDKVTKDYQV